MSAQAVLAAVVIALVTLTVLVLAPRVASASEGSVTDLRVTARSDGRLDVGFTDTTEKGVDHFQIWDGTEITKVPTSDARYFPGFDYVAVNLVTPKEYATHNNFGRVCLFVRVMLVDGTGSDWSTYDCAVPYFFDAPEITAEATSTKGHALISWAEYLKAPEANIVFGTWIQVDNGHSANWLNIENLSRPTVGNGHYLNDGQHTCFKARFWNSSYGVSDWSNEVCLQLN